MQIIGQFVEWALTAAGGRRVNDPGFTMVPGA